MKSIIIIFCFTFCFGNLYSQTSTFQKSYGKQQVSEVGKFLVEVSDQIYLAGTLTSSAILLYEINSAGDSVFSKSLTGEFDIKHPLKIVSTGDGFTIAATKIGSINSLYLIRLDNNIDTIWTKTFERSVGYRVTDLITANDGGYLTIGYNDNGENFIRLLEVDQSGNFLWSKDNVVSFFAISPFSLALENAASYGYYFIANDSYGRLDNLGNLLWTVEIPNADAFELESIDAASLIIGGRSKLTKIDTSGQIIWQQPIVNNYNAVSIEHKPGSGFYFVQSTFDYTYFTQGYYSHYDENGILVWNIQAAGDCESISLSSDNGLLISGRFPDHPSMLNKDSWLLKTDLDGNFKDIFITRPFGTELFSTNKIFTIKWSAGYSTNLKLDYSLDGSNWQTAATNIPADSHYYNWLFPLLISDSAFIRLTDQNDNSISDDNNYSVTFSANNSVEFINANEVKMWTGNNGQGSHNPYTDLWGFYWPTSLEDSLLTAIFADGLVLGTKVNGEIRVNGDTYRFGFKPGKIVSTGVADSPLKNIYTMWKVDKNWQALPPGIEKDRYEYNYNNWPVDLGAPFNDKDKDGIYTPGIDDPYFGDQTLFNVMNDLDPYYTTFTFGTQPIGLEIQVSTFGFDRADELKNVVFKKYRLINKSDTELVDMFLSYWADTDLGFGGDDYAGCDTSLNLAYSYNGDNDDEGVYETPPPAVGHKLVQGPIIPASEKDSAIFNGKWIRGYKNLPMTSFIFYLNGSSIYNDPDLGIVDGAIQFYNNMNGLLWDGSPVIDPNTGLETKYCLAGDPVSKVGWYEGDGWPGGWPANDRRYTLSSGPFNLAIGDTQEIVIAIMMAQGTDNVNSISKLKNTSVMAQNFYESNFTVTDVNINNIKTPYEFALSQNYPNPFNPTTIINYQLAEHSQVTLKIFDILGREVATLVNEEKPAGKYEIEFDSHSDKNQNLSSGIYFYQLKAGDFIQSRKMILIK